MLENAKPSTIDLLLEEYKDLRKQIDQLLEETNTLAKYAVVLAGAIWTWLATHDNHQYFLWWLPMLITVVFGLRVWPLTYSVTELGEFISRIEESMGLSAELGWEMKCKADRKSNKFFIRNSPRYISALAFWVLLLLITVAVPLLYQAQLITDNCR
jgi:hypothetical protein